MLEIRHTIPQNGPFRAYSDIKKYWKNVVRSDLFLWSSSRWQHYALGHCLFVCLSVCHMYVSAVTMASLQLFHYAVSGISSLLHSVNLILFTLLLVHLILRISPHRSQSPSFSPSVTPSAFHSRLKTHLFHKISILFLVPSLNCLRGSYTWTRLTGHWRLFNVVSSFYIFFSGYVCKIKRTTLSFSVYVKLFCRIVSDMSVKAWSRIRSASTSSLPACRTRLSTVADRAFPITAVRTWNALPCHVTSTPSQPVFCSRLKTRLLGCSFRWPERLHLCDICSTKQDVVQETNELLFV